MKQRQLQQTPKKLYYTLIQYVYRIAGSHVSDHIDIDAEVEGSGIDADIPTDTEGSASGAGIDDEDDEGDVVIDTTEQKVVSRIDLGPPPKQSFPVDKDLDFETNDVQSTTNNIIISSREENHISFFAQPGILAAIIGGALVGLLCAILVVMFIVYRMRKKDEGSYALDERKRSSTPILYGKGDGKELYA